LAKEQATTIQSAPEKPVEPKKTSAVTPPEIPKEKRREVGMKMQAELGLT